LKKVSEVEVECFEVKGKEICTDKGIAKYIREINELGIPTLASCSGMAKDGHVSKRRRKRTNSTYISFEVPTNATEPYDIFRFPYNITSKENNYCQCLEEAIEGAGFISSRMKFMIVIPSIHAGLSCPRPTTDEPAGSPYFMESYYEREKRLLRDPCTFRHLSDAEIEKRLEKLVDNLKDLNCTKKLQQIEDVEQKCNFCTK
jgi:hypothetical protein